MHLEWAYSVFFIYQILWWRMSHDWFFFGKFHHWMFKREKRLMDESWLSKMRSWKKGVSKLLRTFKKKVKRDILNNPICKFIMGHVWFREFSWPKLNIYGYFWDIFQNFATIDDLRGFDLVEQNANIWLDIGCCQYKLVHIGLLFEWVVIVIVVITCIFLENKFHQRWPTSERCAPLLRFLKVYNNHSCMM